MLEVASKQQKTTKSNSNLSQRTCTKFKMFKIRIYYTIFKCINCIHYTLWLY